MPDNSIIGKVDNNTLNAVLVYKQAVARWSPDNLCRCRILEYNDNTDQYIVTSLLRGNCIVVKNFADWDDAYKEYMA